MRWPGNKTSLSPDGGVGQGRQAGFTLMEVLVAVTILALAVLAVMQNFSVSMDGIHRLEGAFSRDYREMLGLERFLVPGLEDRAEDARVFVRGSRYRVVVVEGGGAHGMTTLRVEGK